MTYDDFFAKAAGANRRPYEYQCRLACGDQPEGMARDAWLKQGAGCTSHLINIPTGLGKTAAVVVAWMWNRVAHPDATHRATWPRRFVYCLPMRTLVEQTSDEVCKWLTAHDALWDGKATNRKGKVGVHILMGGEDAGEWDLYPEENAILIGTQDMLLSRALNRGYGMSRYRWPMHFGLLNNDCLWVMDETQLMGVGVETSAQLNGFRTDGKTPPVGRCPTWWMSATLDETRLATVNHKQPLDTIALKDVEKGNGRPAELLNACKLLSAASIVLNASTKNEYATRLAELIATRHHPGTLTLVIVNRVSRARAIFEALSTTGKKGKQTPRYAPSRVALIHSRFRQSDRTRHETLLFEGGDRIVIATQAIEAGIDVSARLLITELAPWSSLVQRIGRCNRYAERTDAEVLWVNIEPKDENDEIVLPYKKSELEKARSTLTRPEPHFNANPITLVERGKTIAEEKVIRPVIRRRDLVDLFDTTPDICGQDLDISRYIRDGEDNDVQFFWRNIGKGEAPTSNEPQPTRAELCRVSISEATKFLKSEKSFAWRWNSLDEKWEAVRTARPGATYLITTGSGGYSEMVGWTGDGNDKPSPIPFPQNITDSHDGNPSTHIGQWVSLEIHTGDVISETRNLLTTLPIHPNEQTAVLNAALWHDVGKAHAAFQIMLCDGAAPPHRCIWAKSPEQRGKCSRRGFRHELASALAWLIAGAENAPERDLTAYLIAAHHGKVRLSIRSLPYEKGNPEEPDALFARGIWQGDALPSVTLGEIVTSEVRLDLSFMHMGEGPNGPSWLARAIELRDRFGPFRLAYLETVLRAADNRASRLANSSQKEESHV
jgi:CRISPR-associated endonuclease/helicase Cas3